MAVLWRQPWPENLRGLENIVYKLVLLHGGEAVSPEHLAKLARHFGFELAKKVPSRHPNPRDLAAALRTTRTSGGRMNKTRAALYLGWDPDTLVARMQSEGIDEETLGGEAAWQIHRDGEPPPADSEPEAER
jgi:DNA-binding NtrC family response regulator